MPQPIHLPIATLMEELPPPVAGDDRLFQVGELARETGKSVRALHLYEELGLLRPHGRSKGRFRLYGRDGVLRVRWISKMQDTGLSLAEITALVHEWESSDSASHAMAEVRRVFEARLLQAREQMERLRALESELVASLEYLQVCDTCNPERVTTQCSGCDLHGGERIAPELVRGVQANG